ncbi:MAG TPA: sugar phosphate isomerase/epimerase family protein [Mucilaginibacter sp.]|jgi:sugar phosphate isomerase/epimerase|nr:sugar phosphate isomerase/epimerase family protein [Mucilaginibacter sp.]
MMNSYSRRKFLQASSLLAAGAVIASSFKLKKDKPLLSFSTLGCPDWSFSQIIDFAAQHGYDGIELRGIQREMDLTKVKELSTAQNRQQTLQQMKDKGLRFADLGSSAMMHIADPAERLKNLDEGRRFIDLAQQLECPFIRVFPNVFPKGGDKAATMDLMVKGLLELADHAKGSKVSVLVESHGDLVKIADLETVMKAAQHPNAGMIWDVCNMWAITKEPPADAYKALYPYIRHTHIKDGKIAGNEVHYVLLGQGEVPIFEAIDALRNGGYKGYYSFEWEKLWHPEIGEPDVAFADYARVMRVHFG